MSPVLVPRQETSRGPRAPEQLFSMVPSAFRGGRLSPAPLLGVGGVSHRPRLAGGRGALQLDFLTLAEGEQQGPRAPAQGHSVSSPFLLPILILHPQPLMEKARAGGALDNGPSSRNRTEQAASPG